MGTGNNVLMLGVLTEKVFQILSSGKSSLGTHGLDTSHLFGMVENRNGRAGSVSNVLHITQIFNELTFKVEAKSTWHLVYQKPLLCTRESIYCCSWSFYLWEGRCMDSRNGNAIPCSRHLAMVSLPKLGQSDRLAFLLPYFENTLPYLEVNVFGSG